MGRYSDINILKDTDTSKRYYRSVKYPEIGYSENDFYIETVYGDRLDILSYEYYKTTEYYWILIAANNLKGDSLFIPVGTQLRVPNDLEKILRDYENLNKV